MSTLDVDAVGVTYGAGARSVTVIEEVSLTAPPGELLCLVGPSGCGKTTLLRCVAGLATPSTGSVRIDDRPVVAPPRAMAVVFQDYSRSLLPWATVQANVVLPLRAQRVARTEREERAREALAAVGLDERGEAYPWQLSGGMQQRVAIARALAYRAEILLLDEPFASVDAQARAALEDLLLDVWRRRGLTVLLVTHDIDEAVYLADRILVLSPSPTRVAETVTVDLPRPRDQITTRERPDFAHLRAHVFAAIAGGPDRRAQGDAHDHTTGSRPADAEPAAEPHDDGHARGRLR